MNLETDHSQKDLETIKELQAENERLKQFHKEDIRVTNESSTFHMKECQRLREQLTLARKDAEALARELKGYRYISECSILANHEALLAGNPLPSQPDWKADAEALARNCRVLQQIYCAKVCAVSDHDGECEKAVAAIASHEALVKEFKE